MPHPNAALIERLFDALNRHDHDVMAECYDDNAMFHDIAFSLRTRPAIHDMWRMICEGESRIQVVVESIEAFDSEAIATIVDMYDFGRDGAHAGRPVCNRITSRFVLQSGRILSQVDECDARAWAAMAVGGPAGWMAGRSRLLRSLKANWMLHQFVRHHPAAGPQSTGRGS